MRWLLSASLALALGTAAGQRAPAQDSFFRGKTINLVVGYSVGGGYDQYARLVARHLGRHIAGNPNVIVQNRAEFRDQRSGIGGTCRNVGRSVRPAFTPQLRLLPCASQAVVCCGYDLPTGSAQAGELDCGGGVPR